MTYGIYPYLQPNIDSDVGYWCIKKNRFDLYIDMNNLSYLYNKNIMILIENILNMDETYRYDIAEILIDPWLEYYYEKYKHDIVQQSIKQYKDNKNKNSIDNLPYYLPSI